MDVAQQCKISKIHVLTMLDEASSLVGKIFQKLEQGQMIATAESCTGGLVASAITNVAGASKYFAYGFVSYSNNAKASLLNVNENSLNMFGAVSEQVAGEMAYGAKKRSGSYIGISTSGIAGPSGATVSKPVGMVCFGLAIGSNIETYTRFFKGTREKIRQESVKFILQRLLRAL